MRRLVPILLASVLVLVGFGLTSTASAAPDPARALTPQTVASLTVRTKLSPAVEIAGGTFCKTRMKRVNAKNVLRRTLWWYQQRLRWCWRNKIGDVARITYATPRCGGTTYGITSWGYWWDFVRQVDCQYAGGIGKRYVFRFRQGHFRYCPLKTGCIQNKFPWAWVRGHAGGVSYADGGGA